MRNAALSILLAGVVLLQERAKLLNIIGPKECRLVCPAVVRGERSGSQTVQRGGPLCPALPGHADVRARPQSAVEQVQAQGGHRAGVGLQDVLRNQPAHRVIEAQDLLGVTEAT